MVRPLLVLSFAIALLGPAVAAETAPATTTIAPATGMKAQPDPLNFLTGIYATRAIIEICNVTVDPKIADAMLADQVRYERQLNYDPGTAAQAYTAVKTSVTGTKPDCADGSADRKGVDIVLAAYAKP